MKKKTNTMQAFNALIAAAAAYVESVPKNPMLSESLRVARGARDDLDKQEWKLEDSSVEIEKARALNLFCYEIKNIALHAKIVLRKSKTRYPQESLAPSASLPSQAAKNLADEMKAFSHALLPTVDALLLYGTKHLNKASTRPSGSLPTFGSVKERVLTKPTVESKNPVANALATACSFITLFAPEHMANIAKSAAGAGLER